MKREDLNRLVELTIKTCNEVAADYIAAYQPIDKSWKTIRGCAYIRLSTPEQVAREKGSLEQQIHLAVSEARERSKSDNLNYKISNFYVEMPISGQTDKRPQFQNMQRSIKNSHFKFVVLKEISRLMRNSHAWKQFFETCIEADCEIFIRGMPFNPNDPAQLFNLDVLAAVASYEARNTGKRIKENVFSAMVNSGKFNSTQKVLGLDQLVIEGVPQTGFYSPNEAELKDVRLIMNTFLKLGSYQATIEQLNSFDIKNKNGKPFKTSSLKRLLTNPKYIGEWELNSLNKHRDQRKLMPYERFHRVEDLPHGEVINRDLWDRVQAKVNEIAGNREKNVGLKRVYPLSGILFHQDGSRFCGTGNWGKNSKVLYYTNQKNKKRYLALPLEKATEDVTKDIIRKSKKFQVAVKVRLENQKKEISSLELFASSLKEKIKQISAEEVRAERRFDEVIEGGSKEEVSFFKTKFKRQMVEFSKKRTKLEDQLIEMNLKKDRISKENLDEKRIIEEATSAMAQLKLKNPVALKNAYRQLYSKIVIGPINEDGSVSLYFHLKNRSDLGAADSFVNLEEKKCIDEKLAQVEGLEPPTR